MCDRSQVFPYHDHILLRFLNVFWSKKAYLSSSFAVKFSAYAPFSACHHQLSNFFHIVNDFVKENMGFGLWIVEKEVSKRQKMRSHEKFKFRGGCKNCDLRTHSLVI